MLFNLNSKVTKIYTERFKVCRNSDFILHAFKVKKNIPDNFFFF